LKPKPTRPCACCGSTEQWWRPESKWGGPGEWLCGRCHPKPKGALAEREKVPVPQGGGEKK
jgi:hypothetical protein